MSGSWRFWTNPSRSVGSHKYLSLSVENAAVHTFMDTNTYRAQFLLQFSPYTHLWDGKIWLTSPQVLERQKGFWQAQGHPRCSRLPHATAGGSWRTAPLRATAAAPLGPWQETGALPHVRCSNASAGSDALCTRSGQARGQWWGTGWVLRPRQSQTDLNRKCWEQKANLNRKRVPGYSQSFSPKKR